jgi:ATP-binding cassette subfamily B protein
VIDAEDEPARPPAIDRALLARLWRFLRPHSGILALGIATIVVGKACEWTAPWLFQKTIDGPLKLREGEIGGAAERSRLVLLALALFGVAVVGAALRYAQTLVLTRLGQATTFDVRRSLFGHLLRLPLSWFDRKPVGELVTRMTGDVENLVEFFSTGAAALVLDSLWVVVLLVTLFTMDARLGGVAAASLPLYAFVAFRFRERARLAYRDTRREIARNAAFVQESIAGVRVTQLSVRQDAMQQRFAALTATLRDAWNVTVHQFSLFFAGVSWLTVFVSATVFAVGTRFILDGSVTPGEWFRFWMYLGFLYEPLQELAERWNVLQSALVSTERVARILDEPREPQGALDPPPEHRLGRIEFEGVSFGYAAGSEPAPEARFVVQELSFRVEPGQTVAFVGATGAGKTTVAALLLALYRRQRGAVRLDGVDVDLLSLKSLRVGIGVVPQDVFLFADTILENVRLFDPAITEEHVRRACETVGAASFVERLPAKYHTPLGERGANLSAGERQLLAFARVLVRDPRILILDEATSSVDTATERRLQQAVTKLLAGRTSLVIAHRLSTIRRADQILVLHHGRLRESGTHAELLRRRGIYARLHELQFGTDSPHAPTDRSTTESPPLAVPADPTAVPPSDLAE